MMQAKLLSAIIALSLILLWVPDRTQARNGTSVTVVANIGGVDEVDRAIFSSDDRLVATTDGFYGHNVRLWDAATGRLLRRLDDKAYFDAIVFSPDGRWIATGLKDGKIELWDLAIGVIAAIQLQPGRGWEFAVSSLWIDPKSEFLVAGNDAGQITVWNLAARKQIDRFEFGKIPDPNRIPRIVAAKLTADRSRMIALTETSVRVFDLKTSKQVLSFDLPNTYPMDDHEHYYFPENAIVGDGGLVVQFSTPSCKIDQVLFMQLDNSKTFNDIDKPASCEEGKDSNDSPWSFGEPRIFLSAEGSSLILTRFGMPEVKQWNVQTRQVERSITWADKASAKIIGVSPDLKLAAVSDGEKIGIRQLATGAPVSEVTSLGYSAENVVLSVDGRNILLSHDRPGAQPVQKDLEIWRVDAASPKTVRLAVDKDTVVRDFALAPMLAAVAADEKGEIMLFSLETGQERNRFSVPGVKTISDVRLSPDGKVVAVIGSDANDKAVAVLVGAADGAVKIRFPGRDQPDRFMASSGRDDPSDLVTTAAFTSDANKLAVGRWNGTAEVWSIETSKRILQLPADRKEGDQTWSLAFSDDGRLLIGGSRNSGVFLWDVSTGRLVRTFDYDDYLAGHAHFASVAVSHDKKFAAAGLGMHAVSSGDTGPEHGIKVWNVATRKLLFTLRGHEGGVGALVFSAADRLIVSGSFDGTIRYWDRATGKCMATYTAAPDGRWVIVTESGFFAGSPGSDAFINVVNGLESRPAAQFRDQLYRPDLVEQLLQGDHDGRYRTAAQQLDLEKIWAASPP